MNAVDIEFALSEADQMLIRFRAVSSARLSMEHDFLCKKTHYNKEEATNILHFIKEEIELLKYIESILLPIGTFYLTQDDNNSIDRDKKDYVFKTIGEVYSLKSDLETDKIAAIQNIIDTFS